MTRIYQSVDLQVGASVQLDERASHYLARVLRLGVGEQVRLFNGRGVDYAAVIKQCRKYQVEVSIVSEGAHETASPIIFELAQGIARGAKMDMIIQKAVELGVTKISPIIMERTQGGGGEKIESRLKHWQGVIISACEQCGRASLPMLSPAQKLDEWLSKKPALTYVLSPHSEGSVKKAHTSIDNVGLVVGPEGGLSEGEMNIALAAGCYPLNLGPRILRTETASVAALAILQFYYGDLKA